MGRPTTSRTFANCLKKQKKIFPHYGFHTIGGAFIGVHKSHANFAEQCMETASCRFQLDAEFISPVVRRFANVDSSLSTFVSQD